MDRPQVSLRNAKGRQPLTIESRARESIAGSQFRLELFRRTDSECAHDWCKGILVTGSLRIELSAEHASNLASRMRAAVDAAVCHSFSGASASGELPC